MNTTIKIPKKHMIFALAVILFLFLFALSSCGKKTSSSSTPPTTEPTVSQTIPTLPPATTAAVSDFGWAMNKGGVNVRPEPNTNKDAIGGLKFGEKVRILGKEGDWYKIQHGDKIGYVNAQYISLTESGVTAPSTVASATTTTTVVAP